MKMFDDSALILFKDHKDFDINKDNFIFIAHANPVTLMEIITDIIGNISDFSKEKIVRIFCNDIENMMAVDSFCNNHCKDINWEVTYIKATIEFTWDGKLDFSDKYTGGNKNV